VNSTPIPTAVINFKLNIKLVSHKLITVTAEIGFNLTCANPIKPANSTVMLSTTKVTIPAAHGLKIIKLKNNKE